MNLIEPPILHKTINPKDTKVGYVYRYQPSYTEDSLVLLRIQSLQPLETLTSFIILSKTPFQGHEIELVNSLEIPLYPISGELHMEIK